MEGDSFTVTPARKWTWRSAKRATLAAYQATLGPEANDLRLLEQTFIEYGRSGKGNLANICIPTTKPYRGIRYGDIHPLEPLPETY
ncbi:hypothetical protein ACVXHA_09955 [Escherichia coli]